MEKTKTATRKKPQPSTINIVDPKLVADLNAAAAKRGLAVLSIVQIVRLALGEWLDEQERASTND